MKRILFLFIWTIPVLGGALAHGAVEIYANGHKYDSLQEYKASKKNIAAQSLPSQVSLNNQQEEYIRQEAKQLGIKVDFSKIKTFQINRSDMSEATRHKLYILSVENGVIGALRDFYETRGQFDLPLTQSISSEQLQQAIAQAVTTSKYPKLLISEPGKLRIMALTTKESDQ